MTYMQFLDLYDNCAVLLLISCCQSIHRSLEIINLFFVIRRFTVAICRLALNPTSRYYEMVECFQPEHHITLLHSMTLENQLPFDLFYTLKGSAVKDIVCPGATVPLHVIVEPGKQPGDEEVEIGLSCENFPRFDKFRVSNEEKNYVQPVRIYDVTNRVLFLSAFIKYRCGTVKVLIMYYY